MGNLAGSRSRARFQNNRASERSYPQPSWNGPRGPQLLGIQPRAPYVPIMHTSQDPLQSTAIRGSYFQPKKQPAPSTRFQVPPNEDRKIETKGVIGGSGRPVAISGAQGVRRAVRNEDDIWATSHGAVGD